MILAPTLEALLVELRTKKLLIPPYHKFVWNDKVKGCNQYCKQYSLILIHGKYYRIKFLHFIKLFYLMLQGGLISIVQNMCTSNFLLSSQNFSSSSTASPTGCIKSLDISRHYLGSTVSSCCISIEENLLALVLLFQH